MNVYLITNQVNGKRYIGKTINSHLDRFTSHKRDARIGSPSYFHKAIRKYGEENFKIEILGEVYDVDLLKFLEIEFIALLKPEYNMTPGGDGVDNPNVSPEYVHYMKHIRPAQISGEGNPFYGKPIQLNQMRKID